MNLCVRPLGQRISSESILACGAEAEVLAVGAGGAEAFAAFDLAVDQQVAGLHGELRADGDAVALDALQLDFQPVVLVAFEIVVERVVGVVAGIVAA